MKWIDENAFELIVLIGMLFLLINGAWIHLAAVYLVGIMMNDNDPFWIVTMIKKMTGE